MNNYQTASDYLGGPVGSDEGYKLAVFAGWKNSPARKVTNPKTNKQTNAYDPAVLDLYFHHLSEGEKTRLDQIISDIRAAQVAAAATKKTK